MNGGRSRGLNLFSKNLTSSKLENEKAQKNCKKGKHHPIKGIIILFDCKITSENTERLLIVSGAETKPKCA